MNPWRDTVHDRAHRRGGLTLVELMVSLVLGLLLLLALMQVYLSFSRSGGAVQADSALMDDGRAVTESLSRSLRMARYWGCPGLQASTVTIHHQAGTDDLDRSPAVQGLSVKGVFGIEGGASPDELHVRHAEDGGVAGMQTTLQADVTLDSADWQHHPIQVPAGHGFQPGDVVSLNDCRQADVLALSAVQAQQLYYQGCAACARSYLQGAFVTRVRRTRFFVAQGGDGPSLFEQVNGGTPRRLARGVEDMQARYGLDTDGDGVVNRYVDAAAVDQLCVSEANNRCWERVATVRVALLLRTSADGISQGAQTYRFDGQSRTATDRRLRREFLTVVALRNHRK